MNLMYYVLCSTCMTFQNYLSKQQGSYLWLGNSYPVAYHITDTKQQTSNVPLKKLLSHTATKDELSVFLW